MSSSTESLLNIKSTEYDLRHTIQYFLKNQRGDSKTGNLSGPDLLLICNDGVIPTHALLLAAVSPFFKTLLRSQNHFHNNEWTSTRQILLPDFSIKVLRKAIQLIYDDHVVLESEAEVKIIQDAVKTLQIFPMDVPMPARVASKGQLQVQCFTANSTVTPQSVKIVSRPSNTTSNNVNQPTPAAGATLNSNRVKDEQPELSIQPPSNTEATKNPTSLAPSVEPSIGSTLPLEPDMLQRHKTGPVRIAASTLKKQQPPQEAKLKTNEVSKETSSSKSVQETQGSLQDKAAAAPVKPEQEKVKSSQPKSQVEPVKSVKAAPPPINPKQEGKIQATTPTGPPLKVQADPSVSKLVDDECDPDTDLEDIDYTNMDRFLQRARTCQKCKGVYNSAGTATSCLASHDGRVRCYFCFRVCKSKEQLFSHYKRIHTKPYDPVNSVSCPYCLQKMPFMAVSCHVVAVHILNDQSSTRPPDSTKKDRSVAVKRPKTEDGEEDLGIKVKNMKKGDAEYVVVLKKKLRQSD